MIDGIVVVALPVLLVAWIVYGPMPALIRTTPPPPPPPAPRPVYRPPAAGHPLPRRRPPACPGCGMQAPLPYWEARARAATGMPPGHPERIVHFVPNPHDFARLEALLADEQAVQRAAAAEQDARRT